MALSFTTTEPIAKEGWWNIGIVLILLLLSYLIDFGFWFMILVLILTVFLYRNPERISEEDDPLAIVAPNDGKIIKIDRVKDDITDGAQSLHVIIRSLPFNVGMIRFPINGTISSAKTIHGLFLPPYKPLSNTLNEKVDIRCQHKEIPFAMRVRAGMFPRKINLSQIRGNIKSGIRISFMIDGTVELFLPLNSRIKLSVGDYVKAGESIIGYFAYKEKQ
ncbi:MAG: phosphatidylserine decarboxylase [Campylobacteraceae bacterium]